VLLPALHLLVPAGSPFHVSAYVITLIGKIMCYAIVAVAMDLIWGYTGILSLGHGLFFALGGYAFGMYLMRQIGRDGSYKSDLPDFMVFLDWKQLPWYWTGSDSFLWAVLLVLVVPALVALVFGFFAFRSRIKGVYFSIITQALVFAAMLFFFRNETGFGGNNGFTDFKRILGYSITAPEMRVSLFALTAAMLLATLVLGRYLVTSKLRPRAGGDPRRRIARHVHRLQPAALQALHLDPVGDAVRHRRRALRAAGGHHQSRRDVAGEFDRDRDLGRGGRSRHADRAGDRRLRRQSGEELLHRHLSRILAVLPRRDVRRRHALAARRRGRPVAQAAREARAGGRMSGVSILLLHEVTVSFDGFRALNELSLDIEEGELRCIIGPNGAGKTTMMDVITGKTRADRAR
jgi:hypothetical protein